MFVFRLNCLYIQHLKYILFCCTLVSKCIKVDFNEILKKHLKPHCSFLQGFMKDFQFNFVCVGLTALLNFAYVSLLVT